jgi:hypothetical protein
MMFSFREHELPLMRNYSKKKGAEAPRRLHPALTGVVDRPTRAGKAPVPTTVRTSKNKGAEAPRVLPLGMHKPKGDKGTHGKAEQASNDGEVNGEDEVTHVDTSSTRAFTHIGDTFKEKGGRSPRLQSDMNTNIHVHINRHRCTYKHVRRDEANNRETTHDEVNHTSAPFSTMIHSKKIGA